MAIGTGEARPHPPKKRVSDRGIVCPFVFVSPPLKYGAVFFFREKPFTLLISIPWFAIICGIKRREDLSKRQRQKRKETMNRYECDYNGNIRRYTGVSAMEAIEKFSRQNHVKFSMKEVA